MITTRGAIPGHTAHNGIPVGKPYLSPCQRSWSRGDLWFQHQRAETWPASMTTGRAARTTFAADREEAERLLRIYPPLRAIVRENRAFVTQAVTWAARQGIGPGPGQHGHCHGQG